MGVDSRTLRRLVDDGSVERVARGLYRFTEAEPTEHYTLAAVCARVPDAIVCLLSALSVHGLGTQLPWQEWIAIPHKARAPRLPELPVRVVRFSGASLRYGVENAVFEGVPARITNPARTVVDCFRFRRLVGKERGARGAARRPGPAARHGGRNHASRERLPGAHSPRTLRPSGRVVTTCRLTNLGASVRGSATTRASAGPVAVR